MQEILFSTGRIQYRQTLEECIVRSFANIEMNCLKVSPANTGEVWLRRVNLYIQNQAAVLLLSQPTAASCSVHRVMVKCIFTVPWLERQALTQMSSVGASSSMKLGKSLASLFLPFLLCTLIYFILCFITCLSEENSCRLPIQEEQVGCSSSLIKTPRSVTVSCVSEPMDCSNTWCVSVLWLDVDGV